MNGMLTSEFVRKTQLESDQIAARQIQQTLPLQKLEELLGYEVETFYKPFRGVGGTLLLFTDGLTDSILGENPENRLHDALAGGSGRTLANLKSLVDPKLNRDDVTIWLVKRMAGTASTTVPA